MHWDAPVLGSLADPASEPFRRDILAHPDVGRRSMDTTLAERVAGADGVMSRLLVQAGQQVSLGEPLAVVQAQDLS